MKVEYLILFKTDGTPVYSKCYGGFCAKLNYDETLLSGFLSALTTMPEVFGASQKDIQNMEMGYTKFYFNYVPEDEIFMVLGINKETITSKTGGSIRETFQKIGELLLSKYRGINWRIVAEGQLVELEHDLINVQRDVTSGVFIDTCVAGDHCPFDHRLRSSEENGKTIIDILKLRYRLGKVKKFFTKILAKPIIERRIRSDIEKFNHEMTKQSSENM